MSTHTKEGKRSYQYMFRRSSPGGGENFPPIQTGSGAHPDSYTVGTGSPFWGKRGWGVALTIHSHLALRLKKE